MTPLPSAQPPFGGGGAEASVASRSAVAPERGLPPPKTGRGRAIMVSCWGVSKHIQSKSMTTHRTDPELLNTVLQLLTDQGATGGLAEGLRLLVNEAMRQERSQALQAQPYQRTKTRQGHSNGFKPKTLDTRLGSIQFRIPQVRGGLDFYPSALEKGVRSEQALKLALAEMYVQGVSTRRVSAIVEQLCGTSVSSTQVSQCAAQLDVQLQAWRSRPLAAFPYLMLDARYEKVRHAGQLLDCAVLIAVGIDPNGKRSVLGLSVALSEAEVHWRQFLQSLQQRGLHGVRFIVSDDHAGLGIARTAVFPSVPWQRCQFHLQQNAQAYIPRLDQRTAVAQPSAVCSTVPIVWPLNGASKKSSPSTPPALPNSPPGWKPTCPKALPSSPCLRPTNCACVPATAWNGSTRNLNAAPASPASSPMKPPSCA